MKLMPVYPGAYFAVAAVELDSGECPFDDFLAEVEVSNPKSAASLTTRIQRFADTKALRNSNIVKKLTGYENVFEFRTNYGDRALFGYHPGGTIVISYCLDKNDQADSFYERAEALHIEIGAWLNAQGDSDDN